jgi:hypothetical protein
MMAQGQDCAFTGQEQNIAERDQIRWKRSEKKQRVESQAKIKWTLLRAKENQNKINKESKGRKNHKSKRRKINKWRKRRKDKRKAKEAKEIKVKAGCWRTSVHRNGTASLCTPPAQWPVQACLPPALTHGTVLAKCIYQVPANIAVSLQSFNGLAL